METPNYKYTVLSCHGAKALQEEIEFARAEGWELVPAQSVAIATRENYTIFAIIMRKLA